MNVLHWPKLIQRYYQFDRVDSTMTECRKMIELGQESGTLVMAGDQTSGRGQYGRQWASSPGQGLWASLVIESPVSDRQLGLLPLAVAVVITECLSECCDGSVSIQVKWPNDVIVNGEKLAGVLAERVRSHENPFLVILGLGVNLLQSKAEFISLGLPHAVSWRMLTGDVVSPQQLMRRISEKLQDELERLRHLGFQGVSRRWSKRMMTLHRPLIWSRQNDFITGEAIALLDDGRLLFKDSTEQLHQIGVGEVLNTS